jgi:hypothetical protein
MDRLLDKSILSIIDTANMPFLPSKRDMIIKFLVYHINTTKALLNSNFEYKNEIDVALRVELMAVNDQKLNDFIAYLIKLSIPTEWIYDFHFLATRSNLNQVVENVNLHGYAILSENSYTTSSTLLDEAICDKIVDSCKKLKYFAKYQNKYINGINLEKPIGITHWVVDQANIFYIPEVQDLLMDPFILNVCKEYLGGATPILTQTNFWWSTANPKVAEKDHSHSFHQDQDDIKFIKVFIYLNDVTDKNGSHVYVKDSIHNRTGLPKWYKISNRLTDDFITNKYGKDNVINLTGPKGTMIFENTNGFHKGMALTQGYRYLLQLEYGCSTSWWENKYFTLNMNKLTPKMQKFINENPLMFIKYKKL